MSTDLSLSLARRFIFRAAHHCWRHDASELQNRQVFGSCGTPGSHGHTYTLEVVISGPVDPATGMIVNVAELKAWVADILRDFDYRDLNRDVPEFRDAPPTLQNLASVLFARVSAILPAGLSVARLRLYQDDALFADCFPRPA
jgi:6-pyruvoyltetrahydropterin/6-carboxytetrahydropterin synthase